MDPVVGWTPEARNPYDNLTLFNFSRQSLPPMGLIQNPLAVCTR